MTTSHELGRRAALAFEDCQKGMPSDYIADPKVVRAMIEVLGPAAVDILLQGASLDEMAWLYVNNYYGFRSVWSAKVLAARQAMDISCPQ